jgi:hypothetical protein
MHPQAVRASDGLETGARLIAAPRRGVAGSGSVRALQWDGEMYVSFPLLLGDRWRLDPIVTAGSTTATTTMTAGPENREEWASALPQARAIPRSPVVRVPHPATPAHHFNVLQQWEGTVLDTSDREFSASLRDLTAQLPEEVATFDVAEVSEDDRSLLAPGAVFYWALGYETSATGQRSRVSRIRFRRLPRWTRRDLAKLEERVAKLQGLFGSSR